MLKHSNGQCKKLMGKPRHPFLYTITCLGTVRPVFQSRLIVNWYFKSELVVIIVQNICFVSNYQYSPTLFEHNFNHWQTSLLTALFLP